jgi:hypothetical protein
MTLLTRVDCMRRLATGVPEEWPSRRQLQTEPGLQAGWYFFLETFVEGGHDGGFCVWRGRSRPSRSRRSLFGYDKLTVDVPRRVPKNRQNDRKPTSNGNAPMRSEKATISPHSAIGIGFSTAARTDVLTAVDALTLRSTSIGNDTTLITSANAANTNPYDVADDDQLHAFWGLSAPGGRTRTAASRRDQRFARK